MNPLSPDIKILTQLGSLAIHIEEYMSKEGSHFDLETIKAQLQNPDLQEWLKQMNDMALLPKKDKMKNKLIITYGLPASGKSTWAKKMVRDNPNTHIRVNKDDLRNMLFDGMYDEKKESVVEDMQKHIITHNLIHGTTVIVDNTHIAKRWYRYMFEIAIRLDADFEVKRFDTLVEECIERDSKRTGRAHVGKDVIMKMYKEMKENGKNQII